MYFSVVLRKAERTDYASEGVPYRSAYCGVRERGVLVQGCWMKRLEEGGGLPSARGLVLCWLGCEGARELLADLNVREEIEVSAFSYKACLLGLGL